mgnify:FL=1
MKRNKTFYEAPLVHVEAVSAEHGFAGSKDGFGDANQAGGVVTENSMYSYDL